MFSRPLREVVSWNTDDGKPRDIIRVDLFVRSWVETLYFLISKPHISSTSSWGRELKRKHLPKDNPERSRRPLREVVSWNTSEVDEGRRNKLSTSSWGRELKLSRSSRTPVFSSRPLREVVSWNCLGASYVVEAQCRPLREVVSWNIVIITQRAHRAVVDLFVRSWVETAFNAADWITGWVDLFVRSWVETLTPSFSPNLSNVDLFVRSWVETLLVQTQQ